MFDGICQPGSRIPANLLAELKEAGFEVHEAADHVILRRDGKPVGSAWDDQSGGRWFGQRPDVGTHRFRSLTAAVRFAAKLTEAVSDV